MGSRFLRRPASASRLSAKPQPLTSFDPLRAADSAMYVAKQKGGNQVSIVESRQEAATLRTQVEEVVKPRQQEAVELASTYQQLKAVMDSTSDGILEVSHHWMILYGNLRAIEGLPDFEIGRSFRECFPALVTMPVEAKVRVAMEERREVHFEHFYEPYKGVAHGQHFSCRRRYQYLLP